MTELQCVYCHGQKEIPSYDASYAIRCRCQTEHGGVEFVSLIKRVERRDGRPTSPNVNEDPIGWFSNTHNVCGWTISALEDWEIAWLTQEGVDIKHVYRTVSSNGNQNIVCFRFDKGTYAFMDGVHYRNTDRVRWDTFTPYSHVSIDDQNWDDVFPYEEIK